MGFFTTGMTSSFVEVNRGVAVCITRATAVPQVGSGHAINLQSSRRYAWRRGKRAASMSRDGNSARNEAQSGALETGTCGAVGIRLVRFAPTGDNAADRSRNRAVQDHWPDQCMGSIGGVVAGWGKTHQADS